MRTSCIFCVLLVALAVASCGGSSTHDCNMTAVSISPASAVANHSAAAPGNQQRFTPGPVLPAGCTPPPLPFGFATWSVSDPVNVSISNAKDQTNGVATCNGATAGAITVTATATSGNGTVSGTATLTCN
jgi:hypothetical protein